MIEFKRKYSLTNGNKITKKNWQNIVAKSSVSSTGLRCRAIDDHIREHGEYFPTWRLRKEDEGYIFREIHADTGINGHHPTVRQAVFSALSSRIHIYLEQKPLLDEKKSEFMD